MTARSRRVWWGRICGGVGAVLLFGCATGADSKGDATGAGGVGGGAGSGAGREDRPGGRGGTSGAGGTGTAGAAGAAAGAGGESGGRGGHAGTGGTGPDAPSLFDLAMIRDPATADCSFTGRRKAMKDGVLVDVWDVSYRSWESIDGVLQPILIRGFASRPAGASGRLPGVVQAHGLGGLATEANATGPAALLGSFVLAYTGPGGGDAPNNTSEGRPAGYGGNYRMFDTLTDVRGSWFWGHATAAMRGLTCLEARVDVDPARLGMTGFSAGAVVTLLSASVDERIVAAVPLSGTLAWDVAVAAPNAWQHGLLAKAGLDAASEEWNRLMGIVRADALLPGSRSAVLMVNGSTDEFFPLTAHVATFDALGSAEKRSSFAANFDHGCYSVTGVESKGAIEARAELRAQGGQRMWFGHWFGTDPDFAVLPAAPTVTTTPVGDATFVAAVVDESAPALLVDEVKVWWSGDDSLIYGSVTLDAQGSGVYSALAAFPTLANTVTFVDVEYKTRALLSPARFSLSSRPSLPAGLVPRIRQMTSCLP